MERKETVLEKINHRTLGQERDEFLAFNQKNHQFLREPDEVRSVIKKVDEKAQVYRDELVIWDEKIAAHQELVRELTGKQQNFARAELKTF